MRDYESDTQRQGDGIRACSYSRATSFTRCLDDTDKAKIPEGRSDAESAALVASSISGPRNSEPWDDLGPVVELWSGRSRLKSK